MEYIEVFQAMLADMRSDLRHWLRGNTAEYAFQETSGGKDANAAARLRLCYALAYAEKPVAEQEQIVRALFDAECTAAAHGAGTGAAMRLLTAMLKEYEPADSPLFARAKGCDPAGCAVRRLEQYSLEDCMEAASETGMNSYLFTLMICASRLCGADALRRLQERFGRRS